MQDSNVKMYEQTYVQLVRAGEAPDVLAQYEDVLKCACPPVRLRAWCFVCMPAAVPAGFACPDFLRCTLTRGA